MEIEVVQFYSFCFFVRSNKSISWRFLMVKTKSFMRVLSNFFKFHSLSFLPFSVFVALQNLHPARVYLVSFSLTK